MTSPRLRVAIYSRVSRDDTGTGSSNDRQEEACRLLCQMRDWEVVLIERDVSKSAWSSTEREGWDRIEAAMRANDVDIVVAWKLDRITRRVQGLVDLILLCTETDVQFATTDGLLDLTSPTGKAVATILAAVAQMEVELKAERQRLANEQRRAKGEPWRTGWRSFGYTLPGEVIPEEAEAIRSGAAAFLAGTSLHEVKRRWQAAGLETPRKSAAGWSHTGVRNVFSNPKLAGYVTYKGEIVGDGDWEPILDRETFGLLQAKLSDPDRKKRGGNSNTGRQAANLLTSIATCGVCGAGVTSRTSHGSRKPGAPRHNAYSCPTGHLTLRREEVDEWVIRAFALTAARNLPGMVLSIPQPGQGINVAAAVHEEEEKLRALSESFSAGRIPLIILESSTAEITKRIAALEATVDPTGDYDPRKMNGEALRNFANLDLEGKRAILRRLCRIVLHPRGRNAYLPVRQAMEMEVKVTDPDGSSQWVKVL